MSDLRLKGFVDVYEGTTTRGAVGWILHSARWVFGPDGGHCCMTSIGQQREFQVSKQRANARPAGCMAFVRR